MTNEPKKITVRADLTDLSSHIEEVVNGILATKGFDRADFTSVEFKPHRVEISYRAHDDFQAETETSYFNGYYNTIAEANISGCYDKLAAIPSREQRELHVTLQTLARLKASTSEIQSAQVQAFVNDLTDSMAHLENLLADLRESK